MKKGFEILPFKIVVDSDQHAAFRKDVKVQRSYLRQLSRPWPTECGIFPAEGSTQEPLFQNEILESTRGILYCPPDAPLEKIKESAVALKNSLTGDIFVGVRSDGTVMGSRVSRDAIIQKRDDLVRAVGGILPSVDKTIAICTTAAQAHELVEKEKDFVATKQNALFGGRFRRNGRDFYFISYPCGEGDVSGKLCKTGTHACVYTRRHRNKTDDGLRRSI